MSKSRVVFEQPAMPAFRKATYEGVAAHPEVAFTLVAGVVPGLPNVEPQGCEIIQSQQRSMMVLGEELIWQSAQIRYASRKYSDVLLLTWNSRYLSLVPALLKAKFNGVPTILFGHGYSRSRGDRYAFIRRWIARLATCVLVYSRSARTKLLESGFDPSRVFVAPNSIDQRSVEAATVAWQSDPERLLKWQRENGLEGVPYVLFVSRLTAKARLDLLVEGFAEALKLRPDLKLVIVGSGDAEVVNRPAKKLGVGDSIRLVGALYDEALIAPYFLSAKLLIYPSAIGLSIIHAYSYGLPVVTDDDLPNHNPEIEAMKDGVNGLLYRAGDVRSMAEKMLTIVNDDALQARMSAAARKTAYEEYTLAGCINGYLQAIEFCRSASKV